jgi:hypothetical protein
MKRFRPSSTSCAVLPAALVLFAVAAYGQTFGEITGHLSDSTGASVPAAAINLTNIATGAGRSAISTDAGDYSLPSVPPGLYNVKVEHQGFKAAVSQPSTNAHQGFGVISGTAVQMRQVQVALKYTF